MLYICIFFIVQLSILFEDKIIYRISKIQIEKISLTDKAIHMTIYFILFLKMLYYNSLLGVLLYSVLFAVCLHSSITDKSEGLIKNEYTYALIIFGIVFNIFTKQYILLAQVIGISIVMFVIFEIIERISKRSLIGGGDCKLIFGILLLLGTDNTLILFTISCVLFLILNFRSAVKNLFETFVLGPFIYYSLIIFIIAKDVFF